MKKKIFAIVGYTKWGKSNTLYELFDKRQFLPLKSTLKSKKLGNSNYIVINASNEDRPTTEYLKRFREVLLAHKDSDATFVITISLMFDNTIHDVNEVFKVLNSLKDYEVKYIVLKHGWSKGDVLKPKDIEQMTHNVSKKNMEIFDFPINESKLNFQERTLKISLFIQGILY